MDARLLELALRARFGNVRRTHGRNGLEFKITCPHCRKKYHMYVNPAKEVYNCYACNSSGNIGLLVDGLGAGMAEEPAPVEKERPLPTIVPSPGMSCPINTLDDANPAKIYLTKIRKRVFDLDEMYESYGVRYCDRGKVFKTSEFEYNTSNTIIFPIWMFGEVVGWQSRLLYNPDDLDDAGCEAMGYSRDEDGAWRRPPKYLTNPGLSKGRILYNFDTARKYPYVVITEGVFDAISVGSCAVATFGTGISDNQCRLIKSYWNTAIIMLDPEGTDKATDDLCSELCRSINVVHVKLAGGYKDPGDTPREEIWRQISENLRDRRLTAKALMEGGLLMRGYVR